MNLMFNQSILDNNSTDIGRLSIKTGGAMDFDDSTTQSTEVSNAGTTEEKQAKLAADMRRSSVLGKSGRAAANVNLEDFQIQLQLGRGTFGRVYLAILPSTGKKYAIKAIRKDVLLEYDQIASTALEKDILFEADHPFLCGMEWLF